MKNQKNNLTALILAIGGGVCAGALRLRLLTTGLDEKGLLIPGNPLNYALWAVVIGFMAVTVFLVRGLKAGAFERHFPACRLRAILSVAGGVLLAAQSARILSDQRLAGVLGLIAGICMAAAGLFRWSGKRPSPLFHCAVCVYFVIRLILSFQSWGADPQMQDYALQLMACVSLMLFSFHRASCDAGSVSPRRTALFGLAAVFFCVASLSDAAAPLFYAACGLWAIGAGSTLDKLPETTAEEA